LRTRLGILAAVVLTALSGCGNSPQERVIHDACQALKAEDWETYLDLTVTEADFLMRENKIVEAEAELSFAGSSLRPEQRQLLKDQFNMAVQGGNRILDFRRCQFVFPILDRTATLTTLSGEEVHTEEYILTIEMDGAEKSRPGLGPHFILARWEGEYRILALKFPRQS
jgi:hypothetical protein